MKAIQIVLGKEWHHGLTIDTDVWYSVNGDKMNIPYFEIIRLLLSWEFDLFGLKKAGLAIDKTKKSK